MKQLSILVDYTWENEALFRITKKGYQEGIKIFDTLWYPSKLRFQEKFAFVIPSFVHSYLNLSRIFICIDF